MPAPNPESLSPSPGARLHPVSGHGAHLTSGLPGRKTPHAGPGGITRSVQPELLDRIPPDAPEARASRRDLRVINQLLGNLRWFRRELREHHLAGERVLEIGAGGGQLARVLNAITPSFAGLDLGPRPPHWPQSARWFKTNVLDFGHWSAYPIVISSLFLHHFEAADLAQLGARLQAHARVVIASEPLRVRRAHALLALVCPLIRAHPLTRHDARVSVTAGFRGAELAHLLQLDPGAWHWHARETWLGSCRLVAVRRS